MAIDPAHGTDAPTGSAASGATVAAPPGNRRRSRRGQAPVAGATAEATTGPEPAPRTTRRTRRVKARQVQRVVTRIDPWSMLKVSLIFSLSVWLIVVVAGVLLWRVAVSTGTIGNVESFLAQMLAEDSFTIDGAQIFQGSLVVGLVFFVTGALFAVITSVLFNLISALVGGIRCTVVELETARAVDDEAGPTTREAATSP